MSVAFATLDETGYVPVSIGASDRALAMATGSRVRHISWNTEYRSSLESWMRLTLDDEAPPDFYLFGQDGEPVSMDDLRYGLMRVVSGHARSAAFEQLVRQWGDGLRQDGNAPATRVSAQAQVVHENLQALSLAPILAGLIRIILEEERLNQEVWNGSAAS